MNLQLTVTGMTCGHCEKAVTRAILTVDPQAQVQIRRDENHVQIETRAEPATVIAAITDEGYTVTERV